MASFVLPHSRFSYAVLRPIILKYAILCASAVSLFFISLANAQSTAPATAVCKAQDPAVDTARDLNALQTYQRALRTLLVQEDFDALDCIANGARSQKTRFSGGLWKLHVIYAGLEHPEGHLTEPDWQQHLNRLDKWVAARPDSITARVALAGAYVSYAWAARGEGYSNTVTDNGWNLFSQRLAKARSMLADAWVLSPRCPDWFAVLQSIAQGQGWDADDEMKLFQQAVSFEREYYYYYRLHAGYLLPQWYGERGDAAKFAEESANRLGGERGDILYFQLAANLVCTCEDPEVLRMSWERIQKGFAALEESSGASLYNLNPFALIAVRFNDPVVANGAIKRIGDNWDPDVWGSEKYFDQVREWATNVGPLEEHSRDVMREAEANEKEAGGSAYKSQVETRFSQLVQQCVQQPNADTTKFVFILMIAKDGIPQNGWFPVTTGMTECIMKQLIAAQVKHDAIFAAPPKDSYWLKLDMDPSAVKMATRK
jgi:Domain of unknown function (DUF4034)